MSATRKLDESITAVCPLESIERIGVTFAWNVVFAPEATAPQIAAAQAIIAAFDGAAVEAAESAEIAAQKLLASEARGDQIFTALSTATGAEINTFINTTFPLMTVQQRRVLKLLLHLAALILRRGLV